MYVMMLCLLCLVKLYYIINSLLHMKYIKTKLSHMKYNGLYTHNLHCTEHQASAYVLYQHVLNASNFSPAVGYTVSYTTPNPFLLNRTFFPPPPPASHLI